jgi:hypothetical protein
MVKRSFRVEGMLRALRLALWWGARYDRTATVLSGNTCAFKPNLSSWIAHHSICLFTTSSVEGHYLGDKLSIPTCQDSGDDSSVLLQQVRQYPAGRKAHDAQKTGTQPAEGIGIAALAGPLGSHSQLALTGLPPQSWPAA